MKMKIRGNKNMDLIDKYIGESKIRRIEKGHYRTEIEGVEVDVFADYKGKEGHTKHPNSWTLKIGTKVIEGFGSKKQALNIARKQLKK
jgi:hypothetical protein